MMAQAGSETVSLARAAIGTPYVWGGESQNGFDCSGLLQYVYKKQGVNIPRTTYDQFKVGTPVAENQLAPGDAVFFTGSDPMNGLPGHVGIYVGGGKYIQAPHTGANVEVSDLSGRSDFVGARRYTPGSPPTQIAAVQTAAHTLGTPAVSQNRTVGALAKAAATPAAPAHAAVSPQFLQQAVSLLTGGKA